MKKEEILAGIEARKEIIVSTMAASLLSLWILVRGKFYLPAEKIGAESAMLSTYREHTNLHVLLVYRKAMEMAPVVVEAMRAAGLGSIYCLDLLLVEQYAGAAALLHDAGMGNPSEEAKGALWAPEAEEPSIWVPTLTGYVRKDIGKMVRKQHAAQSAMAALEPSVYRTLRAMGLRPEIVACGCALHSKSTSGVSNLASTAQVCRLIAAVAKEAERDGLRFEEEWAYRNVPLLKTLGAILRPADAAAHDAHSALSMGGEVIWEDDVFAYVGDRRVEDAESRKYIHGELNYECIDMVLYNRMAALRIVLQDANRWPEHTRDCSAERVGELLTIGSEDADYRDAALMPHAPVCLVVESLTKASHDKAADWKEWAGQFSVPVCMGFNIDGSGGT